MGKLKKQLWTAVVAATVGGVLSVVAVAAGWIWTGLYDKLRVDVAQWVFSQLEYKEFKSKIKLQRVEFGFHPGNLSLPAASGLTPVGIGRRLSAQLFLTKRGFLASEMATRP